MIYRWWRGVSASRNTLRDLVHPSYRPSFYSDIALDASTLARTKSRIEWGLLLLYMASAIERFSNLFSYFTAYHDDDKGKENLQFQSLKDVLIGKMENVFFL